MRYRRNDRRSRHAAAAAELALVLPFLVLLMVGIGDFGRLFYAYSTITTCAENGALWACDPASQSQSPYATVTAAAQADAANLSTPPTAAATYSSAYDGTYSGTPLTSGYVKVTVSWEFTTIVDYPGIPHTTTLSRSVRMRMLSTLP